MPVSLNSLLKTETKIKVVDIGANPIDGTPPYVSLLQSGHAEVVGFEPEPGALAKLHTTTHNPSRAIQNAVRGGV